MTTTPFFSIKGFEARERIVELTGTTTIGRASDNTIVVDDEATSRHHALLLIQEEGVFLMDLESTNGTSVNTAPALPDELVRLAAGAVVTIGRTMLHYQAAQP